jgi:hypothetical protein
MISSFHSLVPFLPLFCNCQHKSISLLPNSSGWFLETRFNKTTSFGTLPYNHFACTMQKTQPLYCLEDVFTPLLDSNGSYLIVACVFVAMGMCLLSRCLTMNVYSDVAIPAFGCLVTVYLNRLCLINSYTWRKFVGLVHPITNENTLIW